MDFNIDNIVGSVFKTNKYGDVAVINVEGKTLNYNSKCKVKFLETKSERYISFANLKLGNVKDFEARIICGVACKGNIEIPNGSYTRKIYELWKVMIGRCYNPNFKAYKDYGAKGIKVCSEWLIFLNFYNEHKEIDGYDFGEINKGSIALDKDIKQIGIDKNLRLYSKDTCTWVSQKENNKYQDINKIKIEHNGVTYESKKQMRRDLKISERTQEKMILDENFKPKEKSIKVEFDGIVYESKRSIRNAHNLSEKKLNKMIEEGIVKII